MHQCGEHLQIHVEPAGLGLAPESHDISILGSTRTSAKSVELVFNLCALCSRSKSSVSSSLLPGSTLKAM